MSFALHIDELKSYFLQSMRHGLVANLEHQSMLLLLILSSCIYIAKHLFFKLLSTIPLYIVVIFYIFSELSSSKATKLCQLIYRLWRKMGRATLKKLCLLTRRNFFFFWRNNSEEDTNPKI